MEKSIKEIVEKIIENYQLQERLKKLEAELSTTKQNLHDTQQELLIAKLWKEAPNKKCLSVKEVAEWLGCNPQTVRKYERQGMLIALYPNAEKRYDYEEVLRFMTGHAPARQSRARLLNGKNVSS